MGPNPLILLVLAAPLAAQAPSPEFLVAGPAGLTRLGAAGQVLRHLADSDGDPLSESLDLLSLPSGNWLAHHREPVLQGMAASLQVFDPAGALVHEWTMTPARLSKSFDLFSDGTLVVAQSKTSSGPQHSWADLFSGDGDPLGTIGFELNLHSAGLAVDGQDLLWLARWPQWRIDLFDRQGNPVGSFPVPEFVDFDLAPDDTLWLLAPDEVVRRYDRGGNLLVTFIAGGCHAIAAAPDGSVWCSSSLHPELRHYASDGTLLGRVPRPVPVTSLRVAGPGPVRVGVPLCAGVPNSTGSPGALVAYGDSAAEAELLRLEASRLPARAACRFLVSAGTGNLPGFGGGQGTLCLDAASLGAHGPLIADRVGRAHWTPDLDAIPTPGGSTSILAGSTWYWQVWYRDANPGATSNLTGALAVTFD